MSSCARRRARSSLGKKPVLRFAQDNKLLRRAEILHRVHVGGADVPPIGTLHREEVRHARDSSPHQLHLEPALATRCLHFAQHAGAVVLEAADKDELALLHFLASEYLAVANRARLVAPCHSQRLEVLCTNRRQERVERGFWPGRSGRRGCRRRRASFDGARLAGDASQHNDQQ